MFDELRDVIGAEAEVGRCMLKTFKTIYYANRAAWVKLEFSTRS
jgi:hypothetical protein